MSGQAMVTGQESELDRILRIVQPEVVDYINELTKKGQIVFKDEPYFSRVRFEPTITVDGSSNATYAFAAGQQSIAFSYGQGGSMVTGGFVASGTGFTQAQKCDTNLIKTTGKETNGNDVVIVEGFAIMPTSGSDPVLAAAIMKEMSVQAGFNGNVNDLKYGSPFFWPGAGGLYGAQQSPNAKPDINQSTGQYLGQQANGLPGAGDFRSLKDPIVWMPAGSSQSDTQFQVALTIERAVSVVTNARTAGTGGVSPTGFTPPATAGAFGTYAEFLVFLLGSQIGPRGRNR